MGYARVRPELVTGTRKSPWLDIRFRDLDGEELPWAPNDEWVRALFFCLTTGNYVLTDDDDSAFVVHSSDLEYRDELPKEN